MNRKQLTDDGYYLYGLFKFSQPFFLDIHRLLPFLAF